VKLVHIEHNPCGIEEAKWLLQYLKKIPQKDQFRIWEEFHFWPKSTKVQTNVVEQHLPLVPQKGCFGALCAKVQNSTFKPIKRTMTACYKMHCISTRKRRRSFS
jgi:hypothetical protein